jgi:predicted nuclease of predicted toxin-antitoxin system
LKVLFDQGTPAPLRRSLSNHQVATAHELGWSKLQNGRLISAAEEAGFEIFVTTDKHLKYQQNLIGRSLAIVVLLTTSWPRISRHLPAVVAAIDQAQRGSYVEVSVPSAV